MIILAAAWAGTVAQVKDIEVMISSTQIVGAAGTMFLLLLSLVGWALNHRLKEIDGRLQKIENRVESVPALEVRATGLETRVSIISKRQHHMANYINRLIGRLEVHSGKIEELDFDKEG